MTKVYEILKKIIEKVSEYHTVPTIRAKGNPYNITFVDADNNPHGEILGYTTDTLVGTKTIPSVGTVTSLCEINVGEGVYFLDGRIEFKPSTAVVCNCLVRIGQVGGTFGVIKRARYGIANSWLRVNTSNVVEIGKNGGTLQLAAWQITGANQDITYKMKWTRIR